MTENASVINFDEQFQTMLISMIVSDGYVYSMVKPILEPKYFDKKYQNVISFINEFNNLYNALPTLEQIYLVDRSKSIQYIKEVSENVNIQKSALDYCEQFCKRRALELAIEESYSRISKGDTSSIDKIIKDAQSVSIKKDLGINYWDNSQEWLHKLDVEMGVISTGWKTFDNMMNGGFSWGQLNYVVAPSGGGKCEKRGTQILMFDGTIKPIEEIKVGDKLMGIDSKPRIVKYLSHGFGEMFDVHQKYGDDFTVTRNHTLSVKVKKNSGRKLYNPYDGKKYSEGEIFNLTVDDYLKSSKTFKSRLACWKAEIDWEENVFHPNKKYNKNESSFTIEPSNETEYFGFELEESDQLYMHSDFTVTHNSLAMTNMAINWSLMGYNVLFFTMELDKELVGKRIVAMQQNVAYKDISKNIETFSNRVALDKMSKKPGVLQIIDLPRACTPSDLTSCIQNFETETQIIPEILCVDYAGIMSPSDKRIDPNNAHLTGKAIAEELREIARERTHNGKKTMVISAAQITKDAVSEMEFGQGDVAGSSATIHTCDNVISFRTNDAMRQKGEYEAKFIKCRNAGATDKKLRLHYDVNTLRISDAEEVQATNPVFNNNASVSNALQTLNMLKSQ